MSIVDYYITLIDKSFEKAANANSKLPEDILDMDGMSGTLTRHLYNNLCEIPDLRYLEIGVWKGSSTCSAMYGNKGTVVAIDNWSEFGGPKEEFMKNFLKYKGENNATFIESDCFSADISELPKFNIYMYDGNHDQISHYKALNYYYSCLDDVFIYIVDDWNWFDVRNGTYNAIRDNNMEIKYKYEMFTTDDNTHSVIGSAAQKMWHNGVVVFILEKKANPLV